MATDHRGNIVGNPFTSHGGHLPIPKRHSRIVSNMSRLYGISEDTAQGVLDLYKNNVEIGDNGYSGGPTEDDYKLMDKLGTNLPKEALETAYAYRHMGDSALDNTAPGDEPSEPRPYWNGVPH